MIHHTACVDRGAELGEDVEVGPFTVIGPNVGIAPGCWIGPHVVIQGHTQIGPDVKIFQFASVGAPPQDKKYSGEPTRLEIGAHNVIRESATLHTGTPQGGGVTRIGEGNLLMAYVHIAHDCQIGHHTVLCNAVTLAGHVEVADQVTIGGLTAVHQFCRIGEIAFIGGCSAISMDVPPYSSVAGNRARLYGLNAVGLERTELSKETVEGLRYAFKVLFQRKLPQEEAIAEILSAPEGQLPQVQHLISFLNRSERGITR